MQEKAANALVLSRHRTKGQVWSKSTFVGSYYWGQRDEDMMKGNLSFIPACFECYLQSRRKKQSHIAAAFGICWDPGQGAKPAKLQSGALAVCLFFAFFPFHPLGLGWCLVSTPEVSVLWQKFIMVCLYRLPKFTLHCAPATHPCWPLAHLCCVWYRALTRWSDELLPQIDFRVTGLLKPSEMHLYKSHRWKGSILMEPIWFFFLWWEMWT